MTPGAPTTSPVRNITPDGLDALAALAEICSTHRIALLCTHTSNGSLTEPWPLVIAGDERVAEPGPLTDAIRAASRTGRSGDDHLEVADTGLEPPRRDEHTWHPGPASLLAPTPNRPAFDAYATHAADGARVTVTWDATSVRTRIDETGAATTWWQRRLAVRLTAPASHRAVRDALGPIDVLVELDEGRGRGVPVLAALARGDQPVSATARLVTDTTTSSYLRDDGALLEAAGPVADWQAAAETTALLDLDESLGGSGDGRSIIRLGLAQARTLLELPVTGREAPPLPEPVFAHEPF